LGEGGGRFGDEFAPGSDGALTRWIIVRQKVAPLCLSYLLLESRARNYEVSGAEEDRGCE
jgi:hypothetical protein